MVRTLLYIVRNNFEDGRNKSILGVFTSLEKAYIAGREKWLKVHPIYPNFYMELKVVQPNMEDYNGCSAYNLDFSRKYSSEELTSIDQKIQNWDMWKDFECIQHQKEYDRLFKEFCTAPDENEFLKSNKGLKLTRLVTLVIGYDIDNAIQYLKDQKCMLAA